MDTTIEYNNIFQESNTDESSIQLQEWQLEEMLEVMKNPTFASDEEVEAVLSK